MQEYKGNILTDTISLETGLGSGDCGLPVDTNDVWIIFSSNRYTGLCSANILMERNGTRQHDWALYDEEIFLKPLEDISAKKSQYIKEYDSKNKLVAEGQITNGIGKGYWEYHFEEIESIREFPVKTKVFYENGVKDSMEYEYYKNGKLYSEQGWHNGKENGKHIVYYPNGSIDFSEYYVDGKRDGLWENFYENGRYYAKKYYSLDVPIKTSAGFYENGDTSFVHYYDNNGRTVKGTSKYENGQLMSTETYRFEDSLYMGDEIYYYRNGNLSGKYHSYRDNRGKYKYHGEQLKYHENGMLKEKKYYNKGKEAGTWLFYDETGKLIKTENK